MASAAFDEGSFRAGVARSPGERWQGGPGAGAGLAAVQATCNEPSSPGEGRDRPANAKLETGKQGKRETGR